MIPRALKALSPHAYAGELLKRARVSGQEDAIAAAQARVNFHAGKIPQRGINRTAWVAWHRQSGIAGFGNRSARAHDFPLQANDNATTMEST